MESLKPPTASKLESNESSFFDHITPEQRTFVGEDRLRAMDNFIHRFSEFHENPDQKRQSSNSSEFETYSGPEAERITTITDCIEQMQNPDIALKHQLYHHALELPRSIYKNSLTMTTNDGREFIVAFTRGVLSKISTKHTDPENPKESIEQEYITLFTEDEIMEKVMQKTEEWTGPESLLLTEESLVELHNEALLKLDQEDDSFKDAFKQLLHSESLITLIQRMQASVEPVQQAYMDMLSFLNTLKESGLPYIEAFRNTGVPKDPQALQKYFGIGTSFTLNKEANIFNAGILDYSNPTAVLTCHIPLESVYLPDIPYTAQWGFNKEDEIRTLAKKPMQLTAVTFLDKNIPQTIPIFLKKHGFDFTDFQSQHDAIEKFSAEIDALPDSQTKSSRKKALAKFRTAQASTTDGRISETIVLKEPITLYC